MEKKAVTKEEVYAKCQELLAANKKITNTILREELGDRGSYATISRHLGQWREENDRRQTQLKSAVIPAEIEQAFEAMKFQVWGSANHIAGHDFKIMKDALDLQMAAVKSEHNEALDYTEKLDAEIMELRARLDASEANAKALNNDLNNAKTNIKILEQQIIAAAVVSEKYEKTLTQLGHLEEETKSLHSALREEKQKTSDLALELERTKMALTQTHGQLEAQTIRASQFEEEKTAAHAQMETLAKQHALTTSDLSTVKAQLRQTEADLSISQKSMSHAQKEMETLRVDLKILENKATEAQTLRTQLEKVSEEYAELRGRFSEMKRTDVSKKGTTAT